MPTLATKYSIAGAGYDALELHQFSDDTLLAVLVDTVGDYSYWYSINDGQTWAEATESGTGPIYSGSSAYNRQFRIDSADVLWGVVYGSSSDKLFRGVFSGTSITWTSYQFDTVLYQGLTCAPFEWAGATYVAIHAGEGSASFKTWLFVIKYDGSFSVAKSKTAIQSTGAHYPYNLQIDFHHTGDGLTVDTAPHLYVSTVNDDGTIAYWRIDYTAGPTWTVGTKRALSGTDNNMLIYDGTRILVGYNGGSNQITLQERDEPDTTTTDRSYPSGAGTVSNYQLMTYDNKGDVHFVVLAQRASVYNLERVTYRRASAVWEEWVTLPTGRINLGSRNNKGILTSVDDKTVRIVGVNQSDNKPYIVLIPLLVPVNVYNGSEFIEGEMKVWDGAAWESGVLKAWDGAAWVP